MAANVRQRVRRKSFFPELYASGQVTFQIDHFYIGEEEISVGASNKGPPSHLIRRCIWGSILLDACYKRSHCSSLFPFSCSCSYIHCQVAMNRFMITRSLMQREEPRCAPVS